MIVTLPGGGSATSDQLYVGNKLFVTPSTTLMLVGQVDAAHASACRVANTAVGYKPAAGKSFYVSVMEVDVTGATEGSPYMAYCDNDVGFLSNTAPINIVYEFGVSTAVGYRTGVNSVGLSQYFFNSNFVIPTGKYLYVNQQGALSFSVRIFGVEK